MMLMSIAVVVGLLVIVIAVITVLAVTRRDPAQRPEMTGDEMFTLGVVFVGAGIALFISVGPAMLGMVALGIVFMGMGARKRQS